MTGEHQPGEKRQKRTKHNAAGSGHESDAQTARPSKKRARRSQEKIAAKAEKNKGRRQRETDKEEDAGDVFGAEEDLLADAAEHGRARKRQPLSSPVTAALIASDEPGAMRLFIDLKAAFAAAGLELTPNPAEPDLLVYLDGAEPPLQKGGKATVVIGEMGAADTGDRDLAHAAKAADAFFLSLRAIVERYRGEAIVDAEGGLSRYGTLVLAHGIRNAVLSQAGTTPITSSVPPAEDFSGAIALSADPLRLLKSLDWPAKQPPKSLAIPSDPEDVEHFLDGAVLLAGRGEKSPVAFHLPFDWEMKLRSREAESRLYGLDFVASVLGYWFLKATRTPSRRMQQIDEVLKQREITASALLAGATAVILDCIRATNSLPERAWRLRLVQRRARAFALFLLCCRLAAQRQIKFDAAACGTVFRALADLLERMRPTALSSIGAGTSVAEHAVLVALALPLRKLRFGEILLEQGIESLCLHLELGMSADGVWEEGFREHASVLGILGTLVSDLRSAGVSTRRFSGPLTKLARFASVFLTDGYSPPIAELAPVKYAGAAKTAQTVLKAAPRSARVQTFGGLEMQDAAFFPQAGFFVSRAPKIEKKPASQLVVQARQASLGGPSLAFSIDRTPLLIGGGTMERKASAQIRQATREDPAAHNAVRIDGETYPGAKRAGADAIRIENIWEDKRWSAVSLINEAFAQGRMARIVIHLKPVHALLMIDEFVTNGAPATFEQFWHLAPGVQLEPAALMPCFAVPEHGCLSFAFDPEADLKFVECGDGPIGWTTNAKRKVVANPFIVRTTRAPHAVTASLFRWGAKPLQMDVHLQRTTSAWQVTMAGEGPQVRFAFEGGQLKLLA